MRQHNVLQNRPASTAFRRFSPVLLFLAVLLLLPAAASAERLRFQLDLGDRVYRAGRGAPAILPLKRMLRQQYPGIDLGRMEVKRVVLVAKSKGGRGRAALQIGHNSTQEAWVDGSPRTFHRQGRRTWDKVRFFNPDPGSRGPWWLTLRGKIKVRRVVVVLERRYRQLRHPGHFSERPLVRFDCVPGFFHHRPRF